MENKFCCVVQVQLCDCPYHVVVRVIMNDSAVIESFYESQWSFTSEWVQQKHKGNEKFCVDDLMEEDFQWVDFYVKLSKTRKVTYHEVQ